MKRLLSTILVAVFLTACGGAADQAEDGSSRAVPTPPVSASSVPVTTPPSTTQPTGPDCEPVIGQLSTRQRLAQLLVVGVDPSDPAAAVALVRTEQVGGIFIGGNATQLLTGDALARVQQAARVPVSVAVDDEGGRVQRLDELEGSIPSARQMASTMTPEQVRALAVERGRALLAHGVTVNYAPDVDLTDGPADGVIGDRSFSADPAVASEYAVAFAQGMREAGIQPVVKHFPGHGRADGDSHASLVRTPPLRDLRGNDLLPYERIGEYGEGAGVMVGHLDVPGLTDGAPASLSPATYELLRGEFGFQGPALTDDLGAMRAISDRYPLPEAVLRALQAGADQPLWSSGGGVDVVLDRLEQAVAIGELPDSRVREALERVLPAKGACG